MAIYDSTLQSQIKTALERLANDFHSVAPRMAEPVVQWMQQLSNTERAEDRLIAPEMFPMLLLPRWLAETLPEPPGDSFEADVVYSTVNGYYFVRLIDNLMDHEATVELDILPAAALFHTWFQGTYYPYFESGHPFWNEFERHWFQSSELAVQDARLREIDRTTFEQICAQKICAAKIPLAAMAYRGGQPERIPVWYRFCDRLGCYQQMLDDLTDWYRDANRANITTYFLSEAVRRKSEQESVVGWVAREGMGWGMEQLRGWMAELELASQPLQSADLAAYLTIRKTELANWTEKMEASLAGLAELDAILATALPRSSEGPCSSPRETG